jgi:hypothetical protein
MPFAQRPYHCGAQVVLFPDAEPGPEGLRFALLDVARPLHKVETRKGVTASDDLIFAARDEAFVRILPE